MPDIPTAPLSPSTAEAPARVFISYTHDSEEHRERVLKLAEQLMNDGIDCHLDRFYETSPPPEGWPLWMERQVEQADFVLIVCTDLYLRRFRREEKPGAGLGAQWEGAAITQMLYNAAAHNTRFIPVGFEPFSTAKDRIPLLLQGTNYYDVRADDGYIKLYRHLTGQPEVIRPPLGPRKVLPPRQGGAPREISTTDASGASPASPAPAELRRMMTKGLNLAEVKVLWFDQFETTLDNDLPNRSLPECVMELINRVRQQGKWEALLRALADDYPHVLDPR